MSRTAPARPAHRTAALTLTGLLAAALLPFSAPAASAQTPVPATVATAVVQAAPTASGVTAAEAAAAKTSTSTRITTANLNLRRSASVRSSRILVIPRGATVKISGSRSGFSRTTYRGHTGWASSSYLTTRHTAPRSASSYGVLVNKRRALSPATYTPRGLVSVQGQRIRKVPAAALKRMMSASARAGLRLGTTSGYRSYASQKALYNRYVRSYGKSYAARYAALPGRSEHQTGLAMDLKAVNSRGRVVSPFGSTRQASWVAKNAWKYGFIVRYPSGAQSTTGYAYEPWHVRYVGTSISKQMHTKHIRTLEAYYSTKG